MKSVHRVAVATAFSTWVLLMVGCMVHGTGSSLACPDWPTCYGTFFPQMKNGVEYEHTHRLVATFVGMLTLVLAGMTFAKRKTSPHAAVTAKLGLLAAFLVIAQGVLGGITVLYKLPIGVTLAHLTTSMCFFSLLVYIALRTAPTDVVPSTSLARMRPLVLASGFATLAQIVLGGVVRHTHNGLACFTVPLCDGNVLWPARVGEKIQMGHRFMGVALATILVSLAIALYRRSAEHPAVRRFALGAVALVFTQIGLGLLSVYKSLPLIPVTLHLGVAALILVSHVAILTRMPRVVSVADERDPLPANAAAA